MAQGSIWKKLIDGPNGITYSASKPRGPNIATVANRPFEKISMDYAEFKKHYYLVIVNRYSRIPMVARNRGMTTKHVLHELVTMESLHMSELMVVHALGIEIFQSGVRTKMLSMRYQAVTTLKAMARLSVLFGN